MSSAQLFFSSDFFKLFWHRTQTRAFKDRLASLDVTESMDITGYQAAKGEMVLKVKTAWWVPLDQAVRKEKWDHVEQSLITETGNSARGSTATVVTCVKDQKTCLQAIIQIACYVQPKRQCQPNVSKSQSVLACIRIWVHSGCRGTAIPKFIYRLFPFLFPGDFFTLSPMREPVLRLAN